jgi:hypothetical protein
MCRCDALKLHFTELLSLKTQSKNNEKNVITDHKIKTNTILTSIHNLKLFGKYVNRTLSPDNVVNVVTHYGLNDLGIESHWG